MKERLPCEFFLVRYVPDVVKGEFTNIGVLLREAGNAADGAKTENAVVRFTRDWSRVRCMDADADIGLLESLEGEIAERLRMSATDPKPVLALLQDTLSNSVQISEARASLAESIPAELEQLMRMYVEPLKVKLARQRSGRAVIAGAMRSEFEQAGVWGMMRKRIAASLYTRAGDPMKIDCGYRADGADGMIRMFQAVSLEGDVEAAKGLAYSAPRLREGVLRVESARLELTAVVESPRAVSDAEDEAMERYRFGVDAMEQQEIQVVTIADLARVAEMARAELRV
ncbi:DUF3037 domain-containing protein [Edaphobacter dinghuensis]|uniref:DUF3037 family protein n=1 Tax=Edaphobacter dinghuensis TaxID=1560005 RepID=A0A917H333_9BACT|nr:DUF3037 domain-containing protein [Edaphobacter dinghuensis]GGG65986.1 hypothetical protein GCM10011585_04740 [Edaphobacter dinghuensis]